MVNSRCVLFHLFSLSLALSMFAFGVRPNENEHLHWRSLPFLSHSSAKWFFCISISIALFVHLIVFLSLSLALSLYLNLQVQYCAWKRAHYDAWSTNKRMACILHIEWAIALLFEIHYAARSFAFSQALSHLLAFSAFVFLWGSLDCCLHFCFSLAGWLLLLLLLAMNCWSLNAICFATTHVANILRTLCLSCNLLGLLICFSLCFFWLLLFNTF